MPGNENGRDSAAAQDEEMPRRGPMGDVIPKDRPNVGTVTPEDYPARDRADSRPD